MKIKIIVALLMVVLSLPAGAQSYRESRFYNQRTDRLDYTLGRHDGGKIYGNAVAKDTYLGIRIGPDFSFLTSDNPALDGRTMKVGLDAGFVVGTRVIRKAPLYFETGLFYIEKGGKGNGITNGDYTYNLCYLELPLLLKYRYAATEHFGIEPFFGGYLSLGVGGRIKDFTTREASYSFSGDPNFSFHRFDGGLRFGVGAFYDMFYMEVGYDLGLANISHDTFDVSRNGAILLNFGVNF